MARIRTGDFHKVYLVTAGTPATNTLIKNVVSTELNLSAQPVNASSRDSKFELYISGKIDLTASIVLLLDPEDTQYKALRDAFTGDSSVWLKFATDAINVNGTEVFEGAFMVADINRSENSNATVQVTISLRLTPHATIAPGFSTIGGT